MKLGSSNIVYILETIKIYILITSFHKKHKYSCLGLGFSSEILIFTFWKYHIGGISQFLVHGLNLVWVNGEFWGNQYWGFNQNEVGVTKNNTSILISQILTQWVFWGARWMAFRIGSCSWLKCRSTEDSSFCGKWFAWPSLFCPSHRPCFRREQWGYSHRLSQDPCTTWVRSGK